MKKVFYKMALAAVLALTTLFTACKSPSSGGGGNPGGGYMSLPKNFDVKL